MHQVQPFPKKSFQPRASEQKQKGIFMVSVEDSWLISQSDLIAIRCDVI